MCQARAPARLAPRPATSGASGRHAGRPFGPVPVGMARPRTPPMFGKMTRGQREAMAANILVKQEYGLYDRDAQAHAHAQHAAGPAAAAAAGTRGTRPLGGCLLYTSPSPRDRGCSRMPSSA